MYKDGSHSGTYGYLFVMLSQCNFLRFEILRSAPIYPRLEEVSKWPFLPYSFQSKTILCLEETSLGGSLPHFLYFHDIIRGRVPRYLLVFGKKKKVGSSKRAPGLIFFLQIQWLFLVPLKGGRWHSPSPNWQEKYHLYTTCSPCLLVGYMLPIPTFYGVPSSTTIDKWYSTSIR